MLAANLAFLLAGSLRLTMGIPSRAPRTTTPSTDVVDGFVEKFERCA
jgi:hypothetical protein